MRKNNYNTLMTAFTTIEKEKLTMYNSKEIDKKETKGIQKKRTQERKRRKIRMATVIDGKQLAQKIRNKLKIKCEEIKQTGTIPKLAVILVGDDKASKVYVRNKNKACEEVGIQFQEYILEGEATTQEELIKLIQELNEDKSIHGILLQSPIPKHLDINEAFRAIAPNKDVDGFNPINV